MHRNSNANKPKRKKVQTLPPSDVNLPKMPKIQMPEDFKIRTHPLFKLPDDIVNLPPPNTKAAKLKAAKESMKIKRPTLMQSFTALRKKREDFRAQLMNLICQAVPEEEAGDTGVTLEENMRRYYFYVKYGLDTVHVAHLDNKVILRVHSLLTMKLKKWKDTLFDCTDEMREDFMMSMKKAIVDFVLKDPNEKVIDENEEKSRQIKAEKTLVWRENFEFAKGFLLKNLHTVNPCIAQVLQIWWKQFK